jgi:hypothetical protein
MKDSDDIKMHGTTIKKIPHSVLSQACSFLLYVGSENWTVLTWWCIMHIEYVSDILLMHDEMSDTCAVNLTKLSRMTANHVCHLLKWLKSIKYQFPQLIIKLCRRVVQMESIWELFWGKEWRPLKKVPHPIDRPADGNPQQRTPLATDQGLDMSVQG